MPGRTSISACSPLRAVRQRPRPLTSRRRCDSIRQTRKPPRRWPRCGRRWRGRGDRHAHADFGHCLGRLRFRAVLRRRLRPTGRWPVAAVGRVLRPGPGTHRRSAQSAGGRWGRLWPVTDRQADGRGCGSAQLTVQRMNGNADEELPTEESGYEIQAVIVYQQSGLWFRVALPQGSAWVLRSSDADFEPFPELLGHKLAYLRKGWDGSWWQTPGAGSATRVAAGWTIPGRRYSG